MQVVPPRWTIKLALCLAVVLIALAVIVPAVATPIAQSGDGKVLITLTDEPCALQAVANLPGRITWAEDGKTIEGCYGRLDAVLVAYFSDRTIVLLALADFKPLRRVSA